MRIPIFGELERLINEHGSAVILKERLALAADQYAALEKQIAELKVENERLRHDSDECQKQRKVLEEQLARKPPVPNAFNPDGTPYLSAKPRSKL
jgi:hypothetical protein